MADLRHLLAIYVHAHRAGNAVPPHIDADARAALAAEPAFAASEPSDEDLADLSEVFNGDPLPAMRRALELWGRPTITALASEPPAPGPTINDIWELCEDHEFHLGEGFDDEASAEIMLQIIRVALTRWGRPAPAPAADGEREELAALIEQTADSHNGLWPGPIIGKLFRAAALLREPAPAPVPGWQPMGSAPQDGTEILASDYDAIEIVSWSWDAWGNRDGSIMFPAWWQPLPDHPPIPQPPQGGEVP